MTYKLPAVEPLIARLGNQLEAATAAVVRLDEEIGRPGPIGQGFRSRSLFQEACAMRALTGELVPLEDLVLIDAGAPVKIPTLELTHARTTLSALRQADNNAPEWALSDDALFDKRLDLKRNDDLERLAAPALSSLFRGEHDFDGLRIKAMDGTAKWAFDIHDIWAAGAIWLHHRSRQCTSVDLCTTRRTAKDLGHNVNENERSVAPR